MKYILTHIFLLLALAGMAQQDAQYTQFMSNKLVINPAFAGSREATSITALYRQQWLGLEGAPKTATLSVNAPVRQMNSGAGLVVLYDMVGFTETWNVDLSYAYRLRLDKYNTLSIGAMARLEHFGVRWDRADAINPGDLDIPEGHPSRFAPNFGMGIYYQNPHFYAGLSVPHMLKNELYVDQNNNPSGNRYYSNQQHIYLMLGGEVRLSEQAKMKPAALFKYQSEAPFDMDMGITFVLMESLSLGATYRLGDAVNGIVQYQFSPQVKVGMAYDYPLSQLRKQTVGGLEVMFDYLFVYDNEETINMRYF